MGTAFPKQQITRFTAIVVLTVVLKLFCTLTPIKVYNFL